MGVIKMAVSPTAGVAVVDHEGAGRPIQVEKLHLRGHREVPGRRRAAEVVGVGQEVAGAVPSEVPAAAVVAACPRLANVCKAVAGIQRNGPPPLDDPDAAGRRVRPGPGAFALAERVRVDPRAEHGRVRGQDGEVLPGDVRLGRCDDPPVPCARVEVVVGRIVVADQVAALGSALRPIVCKETRSI